MSLSCRVAPRQDRMVKVDAVPKSLRAGKSGRCGLNQKAMSRIDLSNNSAPLRGGMRPSLEEVNTLLRHDPLVVWDCPTATSAETANKKYFWVKISWLAAFLGMGVRSEER